MRKAIIFATHNAHKIEEVAAILSPLGVQVIGGDECNLPDVEETGKTFEENAYIKAEALNNYCKKNNINDVIIFADDSGLCVDKLDGAPGLYSARFAGEGATDEEKREKIMEYMKEYQEDKDRTASFITVMVAILPNKEKIIGKGVCEGRITKKIGETPSKLTYNQVLIPSGFNKPISELTEDEFKRVHHHREEALLQLIKQLQEIKCG